MASVGGGNSLPYAFTNSSDDIIINSATASLLGDGSYTVNATGSENGGSQETIIADQESYTV